MTISEKLYKLRKQKGLSQEELAERLNVSRQAISKWESGASFPESEKLIAISKFFGVSLDELVGKEELSAPPSNKAQKKEEGKIQRLIGGIICVAGIIGLLAWGILFLCTPSASEQIGASSAIVIDGNGILLLCCIASIVVGAIFLLRSLRKK